MWHFHQRLIMRGINHGRGVVSKRIQVVNKVLSNVKTVICYSKYYIVCVVVFRSVAHSIISLKFLAPMHHAKGGWAERIHIFELGYFEHQKVIMRRYGVTLAWFGGCDLPSCKWINLGCNSPCVPLVHNFCVFRVHWLYAWGPHIFLYASEWRNFVLD